MAATSGRKSVRAKLDAPRGQLAERAAALAPGGRDPLHVVLDPPELELPVGAAQRVCPPAVAVERHSDAARIEQLRVVRPRSPELEMTVAEDDRPAVYARQHPLLAGLRLDREALDVRQRRAMDVEDSVELDLGLQRIEPALVGAHSGVAPRDVRHHLGAVGRWLAQPALPVAPNPRRPLESA